MFKASLITQRLLLIFLTASCVFMGGCSSSQVAKTQPAPPQGYRDTSLEIIPSEAEALKVDPTYQRAFAELLQQSRYPAEPALQDKLAQERLRHCHRLFEPDPYKFVRQAILYSARTSKGEDPTVHGMAVFGILRLMDLQDNRPLLACAILPIMNTKDPTIARYVDMFQGQIEEYTEQRTFETYGHLLTQCAVRRLTPPRMLMLYMLHESPSKGLLAMQVLAPSKEMRRQLQWAEHVVSEYLWKKNNQFLQGDVERMAANKELQGLLNLPPWWVHLYVAEMIRLNPELGSQELMERLRKDEDDAVRAVVEKKT